MHRDVVNIMAEMRIHVLQAAVARSQRQPVEEEDDDDDHDADDFDGAVGIEAPTVFDFAEHLSAVRLPRRLTILHHMAALGQVSSLWWLTDDNDELFSGNNLSRPITANHTDDVP